MREHETVGWLAFGRNGQCQRGLETSPALIAAFKI